MKPMPTNTSSVLILLCTYNGEKFIREQLDSYFSQSYKNWDLAIFDDGSKDKTIEILSEYQNHSDHKVTYVSRRKGGFVPNFMNALCASSNEYDFYSISDQDDIWKSDKIEHAVKWFEKNNSEVPTLYCTRTELVDVEGKTIGFSPLFKKTPSFKNALVQSLAGGNTMVINKAAKDLIIKAGEDKDIVCHDWWIYQLVTGVGGIVYYDEYPSLLYRQHGGNIIGANTGFMSRVVRIIGIFDGKFKSWNEKNTTALTQINHLLTAENKKTLLQFCEARKSFFLTRLLKLMKSGVYRQTLLGNIGLVVAGIFKKI